jgi:hypothetical protein
MGWRAGDAQMVPHYLTQMGQGLAQVVVGIGLGHLRPQQANQDRAQVGVAGYGQVAEQGHPSGAASPTCRR